MYKENNIGVIVPAYNEEELIIETLIGVPEFVDLIIVIDDGSFDSTHHLLSQQQERDHRIRILRHKFNQGLGKSLVDGYLASLASDVDITVVMAGDNQMHSKDLPALLERIIVDGYDYVKGNRLLHQNIGEMPVYRFFGNSILTLLTKFATGYYRLMDPQCGYTAIKNSALKRIPIQKLTRGYGYNAQILCMLNIHGFRVSDVEVQPVYGREKSKIKLWKYIPSTSLLLLRLFFLRLWERYLVRDFHPLVMFYVFAFVNFLFILIPLSIRFIYMYLSYYELPRTTFTILIFTFLITFQSIIFAVWMDMDYNRDIYR